MQGRPLLIIDLAVPRDVDAACSERRPGSALYRCRRSGGGGRPQPQGSAGLRRVRAEGIVEEEIQSFATWLGSLEVLPTLAALRHPRHRPSPSRFCAENQGRWESASERDLDRVEAISKRDRQPAPAPSDG